MIIKSYPKNHLCSMYFPTLNQDSARRKLNRWINGDRDLVAALRNVGYFDHQHDHYFTRREVALLFEYIGDPSA